MDYFAKRKQIFLHDMMQKGYDQAAVQQFIDRCGLVAESEKIISEHMQNPGFINPLQRARPQPVMMQQYGYYDQGAGGAPAGQPANQP